MSFSIIWSPAARDDYAQLLEYVEEKFGLEAALSLLDKTEKVIDGIAVFPEMYPPSARRNIRKAVISKHSSLIYRIEENQAQILHVWDNRQDSQDMEKLFE